MKNKMNNKRRIVALIPARGGSKSIPKKNIKQLNGKPLIYYTVTAAKNSKYIEEVYVSTDDDKIAIISSRFGAKVLKRPHGLATDEATSESVLINFAEHVDFDILVFIQCTSPLTLTEDIDNALDVYIKKRYDSLLSVCEDRGGFLCGGFIWNEDGTPSNYNHSRRPRRQDMKKSYRENGAFYIIGKNGLLKHKNRLYGKIGLYEMPKSRSFEIDEKEDFKLLQKIMKGGKYEKNKDWK
jgi:CMP-N-acetylneuraminic acid synthetase